MIKQVPITISNKIATWVGSDPIVCGNDSYIAVFDFDKEWEEYPIKTVRFKTSDSTPIDVEFEGNCCIIPPTKDSRVLQVGVFAGDLSVTTPAIVPCDTSIICGDGDIPSGEYVYYQIMTLCEKAVQTANSVREDANNGKFNYILTEQDKQDIANLIRETV